MGDNGQERFIKEIVASTIGKCTACQHAYDAGSVSVLGHQEDLWFLSVVCDQCQARGLVAALVKEHAMSGAIGDTRRDEPSSLADRPRVSADDVLEMHQFLAEFDGDFRLLFGHGGQGS